MGSITNFLENELLDHIFNGSYSPPTTVYLALATADPTDAATGASMNEHPNSGGYARTAISFSAASSRQIVQNGAVNFPTATADWSSVTHWAVVDNSTYGAGNVLAHGALSSAKLIKDGDDPSVADGEATITVNAGEVSDYLADILLDFAFRNQAFAQPSTYIALATATISDSDTGTSITEPSGGSYAREQVNSNGGASPAWNLASSGLVDNADAISLSASGADWGTIVAVAIIDAATTGNLLFYDNDVADKPVDDGDTAQFDVGEIDITLD